jgi:hypothetical protein
MVRGAEIQSAEPGAGGDLLLVLGDGTMLQLDRKALFLVKDSQQRLELREFRDRHGFGRLSPQAQAPRRYR